MYTDLTIVDDVKRALVGSGGQMATDLANDQSDTYAEAAALITDVTTTIENYLSRELIVREQTLYFDPCHWITRDGYRNADDEPLFVAWARHWPVLKITSVNGDTDLADDITIQTAEDGGQFLSYDPTTIDADDIPYAIEAICGYRRADQSVLADLKTESGLDDLDALPPILPGPISRRAVRLVIHELREQMAGLVGVSSQSKTMDKMTVQHTMAMGNFEKKELTKIYGFRYVPT